MKNCERIANLALAGLTVAPLVVRVNPNLNVVLTACLTVYVGCFRSVKDSPPAVGLFFYDIFWVFFTPVMVSVAKSFDAPIKLLFPTGDALRPYSMLGLGDIVIPGIFVALALRFDVSKRSQPKYFTSAFVGYVVGVVLTIVVMSWFQAAQVSFSYVS
uniref:Uncharacterized protein n=1 Tax=Brassica campestris TaxID=3711 RepID=M4DLM1_BRACM